MAIVISKRNPFFIGILLFVILCGVAVHILNGSAYGVEWLVPSQLFENDMKHISQPKECLRIVLGIFTVASEIDRREGWRRIIREQSHGLIRPTKPKAKLQCGFNYIFVFGTDADNLEDSVSVSEIENMNNGKSHDWWNVAADSFPEAHLVAKMDSDTMICPSALLKHLENAIGCGARCTSTFYIGNQATFATCGQWAHCPRDHTYASGGLHFLSQDLVQWIKDSPSVTDKHVGHEDLLTGSWLHASKLPVKFVNTASWRESAYVFNNQGWTGFLPTCDIKKNMFVMEGEYSHLLSTHETGGGGSSS
jgi:hypothetical protein